MSDASKRALADSALQQLSLFEADPATLSGETAMQGVLQPLFALSGYRLRAEAERRGNYRFDLIGENLLQPDDRLFVEFKHSVSGRPRSLIPEALIRHVDALPVQSQDRFFFVSTTGFVPALANQMRRRAGPRFELWDLDTIRNRLDAFVQADTGPPDTFVQIICETLDKIALALAKNQMSSRQMHWRQVEELVAHIFQELGYGVVLTPSAKDGGRDVIVADLHTPDAKVYNIEIKHWTEQVVGSKEVRRLLDVSLSEKRDGALLLATSGVATTGLRVRTEAQIDYLRFGDESKLVLCCRSFAQRKSGLWTAPRPLQQMMLDGTY